MRIKHKYLRNRLAKIKARNRIKKFVGGEFSLKCFFPWWRIGLLFNSADEQIKDHQKWIDEYWVRYLLKGGKGAHAPKNFKKDFEHRERRAVQKQLDQMMKNIDNVEDIDIPFFKHQADWDWF